MAALEIGMGWSSSVSSPWCSMRVAGTLSPASCSSVIARAVLCLRDRRCSPDPCKKSAAASTLSLFRAPYTDEGRRRSTTAIIKGSVQSISHL